MKKQFPGILIFLLFFLFFSAIFCFAQEEPLSPLPKIKTGMSKNRFHKVYPRQNTRTYRTEASEEWLTFLHPDGKDIVTFHFKDRKLQGWKINDRKEASREYLGEFCSATIRDAFPKMFGAINHVLINMPVEAFIKATDRKRPVLFTEFFDSGTAQFASSSEIMTVPDDVPAFQNGFTLIKLGTGLEQAADPRAIEGVVAHELAHRVLDHIKHRKTTCDAEREANALIKTWGFGESYKQASAEFGHETRGEGENPCK